MTYSSIALFVYNRPTHTRQTIEALQKNAVAVHSDLIVFSDAAKTVAEAEAVNNVREYIHHIDGFKSVAIVEQEKNLGLANSIIGGVTSIVNERGTVIVLEDDLTVTPHFLDFMNTALDKYKDEKQVIQISGYMFPIKIEIKEDALFLPLTTSWGWATWKRAWDLFDVDAKGYSRLKEDSALRARFNLDGAYDYFSMLEAQLAGKIDSWAVRWQLSAFLSGGLTIYPRHSLVANTGFDGSGAHGMTRGFLAHSGVVDNFIPASFPESIEASFVWSTLQSRLQGRLTLFDRVKGKLCTIIRCVTGKTGSLN